MTQIKEIIIEGMKSTSLKGIPRLANTKTISLKALWTIGLLGLFAICVYQVSIIADEYFTYSIITAVTEVPFDLLEGNAIRVPHILLCNLNPHKRNAWYANVTSVPEFVEKSKI